MANEFTTRGRLQVEEKIDLEKCDTEPIHRTPMIQPHGVFLTFDSGTLQVTKASGNVPDQLGMSLENIIGSPLNDLFDSEGIEKIEDHLQVEDGTNLHFFLETVSGTPFTGHLFPLDQEYAIELEQANSRGTEQTERLPEWNTEIERIGMSNERDQLYQCVVELIKKITEYDRVMLYRFTHEGHGKVEAEAKNPEMGTYLDHHFPSSDIPEPARALYRKKWCRYIPQTQYKPAVIVDQNGILSYESLDLSDSDLRNVPKIHRRYLQNMDVGGSISFSVVVNGELWGLIACHNREKREINWKKRQFGKTISQLFSQKLERFSAEKRFEKMEEIQEIRNRMDRQYDEFSDLYQSLKSQDEAICQLLQANAFYLRIDDESLFQTQTDLTYIPQKLIRRVRKQLEQRPVVTIDSISQELAEDWPHSEEYSGLLAHRLGLSPSTFFVCFRPEYPQTLEWGGDPRQPAILDEQGELSPRNSFDVWKQKLVERSRHWSDLDRFTAREFSQFLNEILLEIQTGQLHEYNEELEAQNETLVKTRETLKQTNQTKDKLMSELHHRVKNNFNFFSSLISLQKRETTDPSVQSTLENIKNRLLSMASLHETLYQHQDVMSVDMKSYAEQIIKNSVQSYATEDKEINLEKKLDEFTLSSDRALYCGLILSELLNNSFEHAFQDQSEGTILIKFQKQNGEVRIEVSDDGRGFTMNFDELIQDSLGLRLVNILATSNLHGTFEVEGEDGGKFVVEFPAEGE